jgi:ribonucleotide reductase alpha subunit
MAAEVWVKKYALRDKQGNIYELTPNDMHRRIAKEFARIEKKYKNPMTEDEIFELIKDFTFIVPQGSPMAGIGNNFQFVSISNCFVIGNDVDADSYGGIMLTDQEQAQLMKRRGGVGHDLSHIRPKGTAVKNSALSSTGVVPFMERYSNTTREVAQDGRRGALMLSCFVPDTYVLIETGWEKIKNVINRLKSGEKIKAWTHDGYKEIIDYQEFENRDIYEIIAENGKKIEVTSDHEFMVRNIITNEEYLKISYSFSSPSGIASIVFHKEVILPIIKFEISSYSICN